MTLAELIEMRQAMKISQKLMSDWLGLSLRAYQDIESGKTTLRRVHQLAADRVAMKFAADGLLPWIPSSIATDSETIAGKLKKRELIRK